LPDVAGVPPVGGLGGPGVGGGHGGAAEVAEAGDEVAEVEARPRMIGVGVGGENKTDETSEEPKPKLLLLGGSVRGLVNGPNPVSPPFL
jgi:hypothetical protein